MANEKNTNETLNLKDKDLEKVAGGALLGEYTKYECTNPSCFWSEIHDGEPQAEIASRKCPFCGGIIKATYIDYKVDPTSPFNPYTPVYDPNGGTTFHS